MDTIVVIIPTYNEAKNIGRMIDELVGVQFPKIGGVDMHLLVVDDNSPDGTGDVVRDKMKKFKHVHLVTGEKQGLGMAYIRGMKHAVKNLKADAVMEMDADFQHPPRFVKPMVAAYLDGAEYVIGSRYIPGGSVPKEWATTRKAISFFGNLFIRLVLVKPRLHDLTTGFRLTKVKGVLDKIELDNLMELNRFAYKVDLLYQSIKNAKVVKEVPLEFAARTEETSKFSMQEMVSTFKVAIILGIKDKQKLIKFAIVGFTGFLVNFVLLRVFRGFGFAEPLAWAFSTEAAIVSNFTFNNLWTFRDSTISGVGNVVKKFLQFNLTSAGALVIQSIAGPIGVSIVGKEYDFIVLGLVVAFLVLPYNYTMYTLVIWKKKKK